MVIAYTLQITKLQVLPQYEGYDDIVWAVEWHYAGTDGDLTMGVDGTTPLNMTLGCNVTPLADLSESTVMYWVQRDTDLSVWSVAQHQIADWFRQQYAQSAVSVVPPWR